MATTQQAGWQRTERAEVITDEDRVNHTRVYAERAFGVPIGELGAVEMRDGRAVLVFTYGGAQHSLRWARQSSGAIFWYLNDSERPIALGDQIRAKDRLIEAIEGHS